MPGSDPKTGDVYYYPYVWKRQGDWAEPEKDRPCCVVLRLTEGSFRGANVFILALSQTGVPEGGFGEVVPEGYIQGLKRLDSSNPTHIVLSEYNSDVATHPSFEQLEFLGSLPLAYVKPLLIRLLEFIRSGAGEVARGQLGASAAQIQDEEP